LLNGLRNTRELLTCNSERVILFFSEVEMKPLYEAMVDGSEQHTTESQEGNSRVDCIDRSKWFPPVVSILSTGPIPVSIIEAFKKASTTDRFA
jgi:hypothetical protein